MGGELWTFTSAEICSWSGLHSLSSLFTHIGMFLWSFSYSSFSFQFLWLQKMSLFLVAEIIRRMGRSDGAIVSVKQKIYNLKNDLFLFSSIRCEHLRPANNFFRHNKWCCVWFSDFLQLPTPTLIGVSAINPWLCWKLPKPRCLVYTWPRGTCPRPGCLVRAVWAGRPVPCCCCCCSSRRTF